jgi:hypothetical protein
MSNCGLGFTVSPPHVIAGRLDTLLGVPLLLAVCSLNPRQHSSKPCRVLGRRFTPSLASGARPPGEKRTFSGTGCSSGILRFCPAGTASEVPDWRARHNKPKSKPHWFCLFEGLAAQRRWARETAARDIERPDGAGEGIAP